MIIIGFFGAVKLRPDIRTGMAKIGVARHRGMSFGDTKAMTG